MVQAMQGNWLFKRLPPWVIDTLTNEQKEAIHAVITDPAWQRHVVNIRVSLPFFKQRFYITVVGGEEKRDAERRAKERHQYPLRTLANAFFIIGAATVFLRHRPHRARLPGLHHRILAGLFAVRPERHPRVEGDVGVERPPRAVAVGTPEDHGGAARTVESGAVLVNALRRPADGRHHQGSVVGEHETHGVRIERGVFGGRPDASELLALEGLPAVQDGPRGDRTKN